MSRAKKIAVVATVLAIFAAIVIAAVLLWPRPEKQPQVDQGQVATQPTVQAPASSPSASSSSASAKELQAIQESLNSEDEAIQASVLEDGFAAALQEAGVPLVPKGTKVELLPQGNSTQVRARVTTGSSVTEVIVQLVKQPDGKWLIQSITSTQE